MLGSSSAAAAISANSQSSKKLNDKIAHKNAMNLQRDKGNISSSASNQISPFGSSKSD